MKYIMQFMFDCRQYDRIHEHLKGVDDREAFVVEAVLNHSVQTNIKIGETRRKVIDLYNKGFTTKEISDKIKLSLSSVARHRTRAIDLGQLNPDLINFISRKKHRCNCVITKGPKIDMGDK